MDMTKDAMAYLVNLAGPKTVQLGALQFSDHTLHVVENPVADPINLHTLTGVVDYISSLNDDERMDMIAHVRDYNCVGLIGYLQPFTRQREVQVVSMLKYSQDAFPEGQYMGQESMVEKVLGAFGPSYNRDELLRFVGNLKREAVRNEVDNGVGQVATVRSAAALVEQREAPLFVNLVVFATFPEIPQPEKKYFLRLRQTDKGVLMALHAVNDATWRMDTIRAIAEWLRGSLPAGVKVIA